RWRVVERPVFARRSVTGRILETNPLAFTAGDFVDVHAVVEIATFRDSNGIPTTKVHLAFTQVIQLYTQETLPEVSPCEVSIL
ncbi:hypothetical protein DENSPDRAFT_787843, partial [Dentipellis sp. KUC8613]